MLTLPLVTILNKQQKAQKWKTDLNSKTVQDLEENSPGIEFIDESCLEIVSSRIVSKLLFSLLQQYFRSIHWLSNTELFEMSESAKAHPWMEMQFCHHGAPSSVVSAVQVFARNAGCLLPAQLFLGSAHWG